MECNRCATTDGVIKIPDAMMQPITMSVASNAPSRLAKRGRFTGIPYVGEGRFPSFGDEILSEPTEYRSACYVSGRLPALHQIRGSSSGLVAAEVHVLGARDVPGMYVVMRDRVSGVPVRLIPDIDMVDVVTG